MIREFCILLILFFRLCRTTLCRESGTYDKWSENVLNSMGSLYSRLEYREENQELITYSVLTLKQLSDVFYLFLICIIVTLLTSLLEYYLTWIKLNVMLEFPVISSFLSSYKTTWKLENKEYNLEKISNDRWVYIRSNTRPLYLPS